MFKFFGNSQRHKQRSTFVRQVRPGLERLEARDCPSITAVNDSYNLLQNGVMNVSMPGVLGNDTGGTGILTANLDAGPSHGYLLLQQSGAFSYIPNPGFSGTDSFTYYDRDSSANTSGDATVSLQVNLSAQGGSSQTGAALSAAVGYPMSATVATFTSANSLAQTSDFTATINWGDGSATSPGTVSSGSGAGGVDGGSSGNTFAVTGTHTYSASGNYQVTVTITDSQSNSVVVFDSVAVNPAPGPNQNPAFSMLMVQYGSQRTVRIVGQVSDSNPSGLTVSFTGSVSGSTTTNADGSFSYTGTASSLGNFTASVTDRNSLTATMTMALQNSAPLVTGFQAARASGNNWTFSGRVVDEAPQGLTVQLGGLASLSGQTATVCSDGTFSVTVTLTAGESGSATAQTTDWWGLNSNVATFWLAPW